MISKDKFTIGVYAIKPYGSVIMDFFGKLDSLHYKNFPNTQQDLITVIKGPLSFVMCPLDSRNFFRANPRIYIYFKSNFL